MIQCMLHCLTCYFVLHPYSYPLTNPNFLRLVPTTPNQTLQDTILIWKLVFYALIWYPVQYFVWRLILLKIQPCKVGCWVPPGTFLIKYGTFVRYVRNKLRTYTYFLGSQKFSFFGQIWSSQQNSYTPTVHLAGCNTKLPEQIWASEAKNWPRLTSQRGTNFGVFF